MVEKGIRYEKLLSTNSHRLLLTAPDRTAKLGNVDDAVHPMDAVNLRQLSTYGISIQEDGTILERRPILNFIGANVTVVDDSTNNRINVTIVASNPLTLTTTGTTGVATLINDVLNIPNYESVFTSDIVVSLSGGKTAGKYTNGQTIPLVGKTPQQAFSDIFVEYINPVFSSFSVTQATQVEVGTTISGSKTFTWGINQNSGVVPTIDIFDVTGGLTLLAGTPNDGSQALTVTTRQLNTPFATQVWRGVGNNTSPVSTFNSGNYTATAYYLLFQGAVSANPTNSATLRALPANQFYGGGTTFILNTGTSLVKFAVALPPGVTITSVFDLDSLGDNITSNYVLQGTISVLDAGGTSRLYNLYVMTNAIPFEINHRHQITTS